jgi:hypothetical protein
MTASAEASLSPVPRIVDRGHSGIPYIFRLHEAAAPHAAEKIAG